LLTRVDRTLDDDHRGAGRLVSRGGLGDDGGPGPGDGGGPGVFVQLRSSTGAVVYTSNVPHFPGTEAPSPPKLPATIDVPTSASTTDGEPRQVLHGARGERERALPRPGVDRAGGRT